MEIKFSQLSYLNRGMIQILMYFRGKSIDTTENIDVHFLKSAVVSGTVIVI
jgi:menaquinone-dependent protoporphyrinogen IX oxidase